MNHDSHTQSLLTTFYVKNIFRLQFHTNSNKNKYLKQKNLIFLEDFQSLKDVRLCYKRGVIVNLGILLLGIIGVIAVFSSQIANGLSIRMLLQPTAFIIVIGGTICATILNFDKKTLIIAIKNAIEVFKKEKSNTNQIIKEIMQLSIYARKNGLLALGSVLDDVTDTFLQRGLQLVVDIGNPQLIYDILSSEISYEEEEELISSRVFEALGGYAPTFGLVGAVLGLINVLKDLTAVDALGYGIATAFVSTLYGVGIANLLFLPIAGNLKQKTREKILFKELILQGIVSICLQESPTILEEKLIGYTKTHDRG